VDSRGGAQHPSYDINMTGTGDVVMTDVRQLSATLVLAGDVEGRFFVRNAAQELIVEVYKPYGRALSLGVEPGGYEVRVEIEKRALVAKVNVTDGGRAVIDRPQFASATLEPAQPRGGGDVRRYSVAGRNRFDIRFGMWRNDASGLVSSGVSADDVSGGIQYTRYLNEQVGITFNISAGGGQVGAVTGPDGVFSGVSDVVMMPVGARWNPFQYGRQNDAVKPFFAAAIGPVIGNSVGSFSGRGGRLSGAHSRVSVGGYLKAGADLNLSRWFGFTADGGYNWMADFAQPVGPIENYSGFSFNLGFGFLWGRGSP
jgi:hypothetical protein